MAISNIIAQVEAGFPVMSVINPAKIPPIMPPTSNKVDKVAASEAGIPEKKKLRFIFFLFSDEISVLVCL